MLLKNKNIGIKQPLFYQTTVVKIIEEHFLSLSELERNRENVYFFFISCNKVVACDWSQGTFNSCPVFDFEGISEDKPICDLGYIIEQVDGRWCNQDCKKFYNNISEYIKVKGGKSG